MSVLCEDTIKHCTMCYYPAWTSKDRPRVNHSDHEVILDDFAATIASAEQGCNGCKFLSQVWQHAIPETSALQQSKFCFNRSSGSLYVHIFSAERVVDIETLTLHDEPSFQHVRIASLLPPSTHLEDNLSYIQTWLTECQRIHPRCSTPVSYVPKRLVDIDHDETQTVRLVELPSASHLQTPSASIANDDIAFACLSHCWGQVRSKYITSSRTLASNMNAIPISELPKTFRDAIKITRAIGIRYLWIDSLCIVQDSEPDWSAHVGRMAAIYENAYITLAAGASEDDEGGFFAVPQKRFAHAHLLPMELEGCRRNIYVRHGVDHPDADWPARELLPLMRRGWCFQERLLSRRYLCFGSTEVLWECMEDVACTCSMGAGPFNPRDSDREPAFRDCSATKLRLTSATANHRELWQNLASQYHRRELTYARDKLPALAGLADAFQRKFDPGAYHFGMWSSWLKQDLAWNNVSTETSLGRPTRGPSWSWTQSCRSSDRIEFTRFHEDYYYQLHEIIEPEAGNETLDFTALLLSGTIITVGLRTYEQRDSFESIFFLSRRCRVFERQGQYSPDQDGNILSAAVIHSPLSGSASDPLSEANSEWYKSTLRGGFTADYRFWDSEQDLQHELHQMRFLVLGVEASTYTDRPEEEHCWIAGMLLRPVDAQDMGPPLDHVDRYERVGWLRYCTNKTRDEFTLNEKKTKFLIV